MSPGELLFPGLQGRAWWSLGFLGAAGDRAEACSALLLPHCGVFRLSSSALGLSQDMPQSPGLVWGAQVTHPP